MKRAEVERLIATIKGGTLEVLVVVGWEVSRKATILTEVNNAGDT